MTDYKVEKKQSPGRTEVEILGETYEAGKPEDKEQGRWQQKLADRQERLKYLQSSGQYWLPKGG